MMGRRMTVKKKTPPLSGTSLVVVLLVLSVALVSIHAQEGSQGPLHRIQSIASMITSPLRLIGSGVAYAADAAGDVVEDVTVSDAAYTALQEENAELKAQLVEMEELRQENERLTSLLEVHELYDISGATGLVIGSSSDSYSSDITVSVGSSSGVEVGQAVVGPGGLVGQVMEVSPLTCRVRLLTDPQSGISAYLQDSRAEGIVSGSVDGLLYLEYVDDSVQVEVGDVVVTSGMGGSYPAGIAIGTVTNVISKAGTAERTIIVTPLAEADALEEVTIVFSTSGDTSYEVSTDEDTDSGATDDTTDEDTTKEDANDTESGE